MPAYIWVGYDEGVSLKMPYLVLGDWHGPHPTLPYQPRPHNTIRVSMENQTKYDSQRSRPDIYIRKQADGSQCRNPVAQTKANWNNLETYILSHVKLEGA